MAVCLLRIGEALPTKLTPSKLCRGDIRFIYKDGELLEVILRIYPLKQSARARKAGKKIPIAMAPYNPTKDVAVTHILISDRNIFFKTKVRIGIL